MIKEEEKLDLTIITNKEIKKYLSPEANIYNSYNIYTIGELAELLELKDPQLERDNFSDSVITLAIASSNKKIINFHIKSFIQYNQLKLASYLITLIGLVLSIKLAITLFADIYSLHTEKQKIAQLENTSHTLERKYSNLQRNSPLNAADAENKFAIENLYQLLTADKLSPFPILNKFKMLKSNKKGKSTFLISSFDWEARETNIKANPNKSQFHEEQFNAVMIDVNLDYLNDSGGYRKLFNKFDQFTARLKNSFKGYEVEYSLLTEQITFSNAPKIIPVNVKITSHVTN